MSLAKDGTNSKPAKPAKTGSSRPTPTPTPGLAPTPSTAPRAKPAPVIGPVAPGSPAAKADPSRVANPVAPRKAPTKAAPKPAAAPAAANINGVPHDVYIAIIRAADENGVPRDLALAMAQQESGFNTHSVGDHGSSFGLYQLHKGGELTSAGLTPEQAYDAYTNASVALKVVGSVIRQHPDWSPGQIAAAAQRPADPVGYAKSVNGILKTGTFKAVPASSTGSSTAAATSGGGTTVKGDTTPAVDTYQADPGMSIDNYGFIKALAATEPDINRLMREYANQDLSNSSVAAKLEAELRDTPWYKSHTAGERSQEVLKATDPTEYNRKYQATQQQMQTAASGLGVQLGAEALTRLTKHVLAENWSQQQVNQFLTQFGAVSKGGHGTIQATADSLKQRATDYMVPISDAAAQKWAVDIAAGRVDQNAYDAYLKEQAKSLFPSLSSAIDRGVTVKTYTDPYRTIAASTLEVDPDSIDFMHDPKYSKALYSIDPKTKERTPMSLSDWGTYLRGLPDYAKTAQANQQAAGMATSILNTFGKVAS